VFVTGWLADRFALHMVVGAWGLLGVALALAAVLTWPGAQQISDEIARAQAMNKAAEEAEAASDDPAPAPAEQPERDIWGLPGGQVKRAVGRARVATRTDDPGQIVAPRHGEEPAGRHAREARRRISRPVGRIYSTGSARDRATSDGQVGGRPSRLRPPGWGDEEPMEPLGPPGADLMGAAAAAGLLGEPSATDPQWYPLAEPPASGRAEESWPSPNEAGWENEAGWDPETRAQRAHRQAVQQHAAHQQQRTDQTHRGDQLP
jgi:hypothetical protein